MKKATTGWGYYCCLCGDRLREGQVDQDTGYPGPHQQSACPSHTDEEHQAFCCGESEAYCSDCGVMAADLDSHECKPT